MSVIHYNTEELLSAASKFNGSAELVQDIITEMNNVNENLAGEWAGPAREKFAELFAEVSPDFQKFVALIVSTGELLTDVANHMAQSEEAAVNGMGIVTG